jgi:hypothetical protein
VDLKNGSILQLLMKIKQNQIPNAERQKGRIKFAIVVMYMMSLCQKSACYRAYMVDLCRTV